MSAASQATQQIKNLIATGVSTSAQDPLLSLNTWDVAPVTKAVADKVVPAVLHATNNEPWYQSRVTWGAIVSIATGVLGALGVATDWIDPDQVIALGLGFGSVAGGLVTLYGRWKARKPIGMA